MARTATIVRETSESKVELSLNLDGTGKTDIDTSVPFYNHMMTALGKHSLIDLTIHAHGDTDIDVHHTVEDTAIVFGEALKQALGDKKGIRRFADATVPLDEALAKAVVDISGRPYCVCSGEPEGYEFCMIGGHFTGSLVRHVMESIAFHAGICLHMQVLAGRDPHHIAEAEFKALARALRFAIEPDPRVDLSGTDVIRKLVILTREAGYAVEQRDVERRTFLPESCFEGSIDEFWHRLPETDARFETWRRRLETEGKRLRFIARMEDGRTSVGLEEVDNESPFYHLSGSNNVILITTERYRKYPIQIKGYGAGAEVTAAGVFADIIRIANIR